MVILGSLLLVKQFLYCGGPYLELSDWLDGSRPPTEISYDWPQFRDRLVIGTFRGRSAVALACRILGIGAGHEVLVPAYNCGTELDALLHAGVQTVGYQVSRQCRVNLEDVMARRTSRTRAVYLIHYFGWEQPMEQLRRWCDEQELFLIEDCALALFSSGSSNAIGRTGDAAIFSLSKTLGSWHGGLLSLSKASPDRSPGLKPAGSGTLLKELWHSMKATVFRSLESLGLYGVVHSARQRVRSNLGHPNIPIEFPPMPESYCFSPSVDADRAIHPQVWTVAGALSREGIIHRRRHNYQRLAEVLHGVDGASPLYPDLPDGVCPLAFPLLVPNRDACVQALQDSGVAAFPWWAGFHQRGINWTQFPEACQLKKQILTLPVHQDLDDEHLTYVAKTATRLLQFGST